MVVSPPAQVRRDGEESPYGFPWLARHFGMERERADPGIHRSGYYARARSANGQGCIDDVRRAETLGKRSDCGTSEPKPLSEQHTVNLVEFDNQPRLDVGYRPSLTANQDVWPTRFGEVDFGHDHRRIADGSDRAIARSMALTVKELFASPDHIFTLLKAKTAVFVPMNRAAYHRSIFLDARISSAIETSTKWPVIALVDRTPPPAPMGWIFHVAHCGSTLLARAIDHLTTNLILREPFALRQVALAPDAQRLATVMAMLSKRYREDLPTIVKANVPVNFMLADLAAFNPQAPAIILYLDLADYLIAVLRSKPIEEWVEGSRRCFGPPGQ